MKQIYTQKKEAFNSKEISFAIKSILCDEDLNELNLNSKDPYSRLLLLSQGTGRVNIDFNSYETAANTAFFIRPNQVLQLCECHNTVGFLLSFSKSYLGSDDENNDSESLVKLFRFFSSQIVRLQDETMEDMKFTLEKMIMEQNNDNLYRTELLKRYFRILLIYIMRQAKETIEPNGINRNVALVERFMNLLDKGYIDKKLVSNYADELCVSANYLNQIIKKMTGFSAGYHIRERIVLEAKRKAVYTNRSMKEIGYLLGFEDPSHFSKLFKKSTGINFIDFRRSTVSAPIIQEMQHIFA